MVYNINIEMKVNVQHKLAICIREMWKTEVTFAER